MGSTSSASGFGDAARGSGRIGVNFGGVFVLPWVLVSLSSLLGVFSSLLCGASASESG
jgi:hypothetical protein